MTAGGILPDMLRSALLLAFAQICALLSSPVGAQTTQPQPSHDVIIRSARVIDGAGNPWFYADLAIDGDRIAAVGDLRGATAALEIDAGGKVVAPGFIDVHTHADDDLYKLPAAENFVRQGVTTIVSGNCGSSVRDVAQYFDNLQKRGVGLNVATLYGHNTILRAVKGSAAGELTPVQMEQARQLMDKAMRDGAVGLSTGLIYTPGRWSSTEEIIEIARVSAAHGGIYASHMRSEGHGILEAIDEALRVGREAGCRVQISHFKMPTDVAARMGGSDVTLARVVAARDAGQEVWIDQYPYTASSTTINTVLPDWVLEDGPEAAKQKLNDPDTLARVLDDMRKNHEIGRGRKSMAYAVIASCKAFPQYEGKNLQQVAVMRKLEGAGDLLQPEGAAPTVTMEDQYRAAIAIYLAGGASCVFHTMDEQQVENIMRHPLVGIASDSGVREFNAGQPHPRGYGTNARVLGRYVRERKLITLEEAVRKMTSMPARAFRFDDRGVLRPGASADVVVFDPDTVIDKATFDAPHAYAEGFEFVFVNGVAVIRDGQMTGALPGRPVYGPGRTLPLRRQRRKDPRGGAPKVIRGRNRP